MNDKYSELKAAAMACEVSKCADEDEEKRRFGEFFCACEPDEILALLAEHEALQYKYDEAALAYAGLTAERDALLDGMEVLRGCLREFTGSVL